MFITSKYSGYNRHGEQIASGLFLILAEPKNDSGRYPSKSINYPIRAIVRHTSMRQLGHFMMGFARVLGHRITLSGSYGANGLVCTVPDAVYDAGVELPGELREAWNTGNGWNSAGSEAPAIRKWALANLAALRGR